MLRGELSAEIAKRWAWDGPREGEMCGEFVPERDLKDFYDI